MKYFFFIFKRIEILQKKIAKRLSDFSFLWARYVFFVKSDM